MHYNNYYQHHHHHNPHNKNSYHSTLLSPTSNRHNNRYSSDLDNDIDERIFEFNNYNTNYNLSRSYLSPSPSPVRETVGLRKTNNNNINGLNDHKRFIDHELEDKKYVERYELESPTSPDDILKLKWLDYSPRMSRLRDQKNKRLMTRLEQFELWDAEQAQKQKQFELAREQRYKNIVDRLKTQDFCLNQMRRRHESDIETSRDLEVYEDEHYYVDALDNAKPKQQGPISQFRKFQAEMDDKLKTLQDEIDSVNPRCKIEQTILPRLERTRETYSMEPDVFTVKGKRVLKRPQLGNSGSKGQYDENLDEEILLKNYRLQNGHSLDDDGKAVKFYYPCAINDEDLLEEKVKLENRKLKPIIHAPNNNQNNVDDLSTKTKLSNGTNERKVYFEDDVRTTKSNNNETKTDKVVINDNSVDDELASEMVVKSNISEPINKENDVAENIINEITSTNNDNQEA